MTTPTQARLSSSSDPHTHVFQIDFDKPSRSVCVCGKVKQCRPIPWSDSGDAKPKPRQLGRTGRAKAGRKAKRPAAKAIKWKRGVKG